MARHLQMPTVSQGFKSYMGFLARTGLPQMKPICEEYISLGNRHARLRRYIEEFGSNWPLPDEGANDRHPAASALLDGLDEDEEEAEPTPAPQRRSKRSKSSNGSLAVGQRFTYHGRSRASTWTVLRVGHRWTTKGGRKHQGYLARNDRGQENGWDFRSVERYISEGRIDL